MSTVRVYSKVNRQVLAKIKISPEGPVAKALLKRGYAVQAQARKNLGGGTLSGPKRVDTGLLRSSINVQLLQRRNGLVVRVGTNVYYARWVHDGTGIYGPRHIVIKPKNGHVLVFRASYGAPAGPYRGKVVVRSVKGMKPNRFLVAALPAADLHGA